MFEHGEGKERAHARESTRVRKHTTQVQAARERERREERGERSEEESEHGRMRVMRGKNARCTSPPLAKSAK